MKLWVLNLDADLELATSGQYAPSRRVLQTISPSVRRAASALLEPGDALLEPNANAAAGGRPALGRCWCPTPNALARLRAAGCRIEPAPALSVLRAVNHRRFCLDLGGGAPNAFYVDDTSSRDRLLAEIRKRTWLCKRPHSLAGRGQRRLTAEPSPDDWRWLAGASKRGGFVAEPWLRIHRELCLHGYLLADGGLKLGRLCEQRVDRHGAWMNTVAARADLNERHRERFERSATDAAAALHRAGYFGPFGIDGYEYHEGDELALNPLSEINARYCMGYATGMRGEPDSDPPKATFDHPRGGGRTVLGER